MNKLFSLFALGAFLLLTACKKEKNYASDGTVTIQVINAAIGVSAIKLNMSNAPAHWWNTMPQVSYGASSFFYAPRTATPITIVSSADTTSPLVNANFNFTGKIYTLYIAGQSPTVDTIIREESNYPYIRLDQTPADADSVVHVRFVNLSPNKDPININILGSTAKEATNLEYKAITDFKAYAARLANTNYEFEVRNAANDSLLLTYTFNITATNRFKNVALVLKGLIGDTASTFSVFPVNYFQ